MKKLGIKIKLIVLFAVIKVIPLVLITYIALVSATKLGEYFNLNTLLLFNQNKEMLKTTTTNAINDSIKALDEKSQQSLEKLSVVLSSQIADFLYERDNDILFLSKSLTQNNIQKIINNFYDSKMKDVLIPENYEYDDKNQRWMSAGTDDINKVQKNMIVPREDNKREFHVVEPLSLKMKKIPIYKEIVFVDTQGNELYKKSTIRGQKLDISKKENTYIKSEMYWDDIQNLKDGEIYVSDVIGAYIPSKIIGTFSKEKALKSGIDFKPELHGYAGKENPKGKQFEGIIRFIVPIFKKNKKIGYISLALDHKHIMEFTDSFDPINSHMKKSISNASDGNYAFMWDYEARNISHPRDYFIVGFDPKTGERVPGWLSEKVALDFKESKQKKLNDFLKTYPKFDNQSLDQKPYLSQVKEKGEIALDCRYLNFAPQCQGWMNLTQNGGSGSFIIFWSNVWKLNTAATIPYYTGKYGDTKRGFGFVTIGANVDEFHKVADKTKENVAEIISAQSKKMEDSLAKSSDKISSYITLIVNELTIVTVLMIILVVVIAIIMSNYITSKIKDLIAGTKEFAKHNLDYQIKVKSNDEIGELEKSFNQMARDIKSEIKNNQKKERLLVQQSKMVSMGEMIGNIAHQWRQPLSVISTGATGMKMQKEYDLLKDEDFYKMCDDINNNAQYLSKTIDDFRNFIKGDRTKVVFDLKEDIDSFLHLVEGSIKSNNINMILDLDANINIDGYQNELIQCFINIFNNTKDAMKENKNDERYLFISSKKNEDNAIIIFRDNAGGIPENIIEKIFEPYFTTKNQSQGTGLGLHMTYNLIVDGMKGSIIASNVQYKHENIQYKGAEFTITLPLS